MLAQPFFQHGRSFFYRMSSVRLSACDASASHGLWSHRLEILETNCTHTAQLAQCLRSLLQIACVNCLCRPKSVKNYGNCDYGNCVCRPKSVKNYGNWFTLRELIAVMHRMTWGRWKRGTGKRGTVKNAGVEKAGLENAGPYCRGGKRGTGKRGTRYARVENAGPPCMEREISK